MTHDDYESTPSQGRVERRGMINISAAGGRRRRRFLTGAATVAAGALFASSAAWACTLRQGTLEVFDNSYSDCASAGTAGIECSRVSGTGGQTGMAKTESDGSTVMRIKGSNFIDTVTGASDPDGDDAYLITFRRPGSAANCHRKNLDAGVAQLGAEVDGPSFDVTRTHEDLSNQTVRTGLARICVQDVEIGDLDAVNLLVVTGQIVDVTVTL